MLANKKSIFVPRLFSTNFFCNFFISFWAFAIFNIPYFKIYFPGNLINVVTLLGFYLTILLSVKKISLNSASKLFLSLLSFFWTIVLISGIRQKSVLDPELILSYISVYLYVVPLLLFVKNKHIAGIVYCQILFGTILSILQILGIVDFYKFSDRVHHTTFGLPIGASFVALIGLIFFSSRILKTVTLKRLLWFCSIVNLFCLSSLPGRAIVIFSGLVIFIFFILQYYFYFRYARKIPTKEKKLTKFFKTTIILSVLASIAMVNLQFKLSDNFLDRYHRLFYNAEQEARTQLYFEALEFIKNNILGYGLNSSFSLIGYYPHNIFLEIMLSCGIIGFIIFLIILAIYFYKFKLAILDRFYSLPLCMMSLYIFLLWNISYDLSRSYVPLGIIAVVIGSSNSQNK